MYSLAFDNMSCDTTIYTIYGWKRLFSSKVYSDNINVSKWFLCLQHLHSDDNNGNTKMSLQCKHSKCVAFYEVSIVDCKNKMSSALTQLVLLIIEGQMLSLCQLMISRFAQLLLKSLGHTLCSMKISPTVNLYCPLQIMEAVISGGWL